MGLILSTFGIIFLAELPDKTALASVALATRYRSREVILGVWTAFLLQTAVATAAGNALHLLPTTPIRIAAACSFFVFGALTFVSADDPESSGEQAEADPPPGHGFPPALACFLVIFAAEWGDLTQLATAALVANTGRPVPVFLGAVAALWSVTAIAVAAGAQLRRLRFSRAIQRASALLYVGVGCTLIVAALV
jgi:putative Ca2+/H+ antiporter (TMEM165/GDT1 family)